MWASLSWTQTINHNLFFYHYTFHRYKNGASGLTAGPMTGHKPSIHVLHMRGHKPSTHVLPMTGHEPSTHILPMTGHEPSTHILSMTGHQPSTHVLPMTGHQPPTHVLPMTAHKPSTHVLPMTGHKPSTHVLPMTGHEPSTHVLPMTGHKPSTHILLIPALSGIFIKFIMSESHRKTSMLHHHVKSTWFWITLSEPPDWAVKTLSESLDCSKPSPDSH